MRKRIFVTGGTGFIGRAAIKKFLSLGWHVRSLAHSKNNIPFTDQNLEWVIGDIRDRSWTGQVTGCKVFVHLAGIHGHIRMSFAERVSIELDGTKNAVAAAKRARITYFIHVGTAYTDLSTEYARAKLATQAWLHEEMVRGFPVTIVCPVVIYGPGDRTNLKRLFTVIASGRFFFIGNGKNIWQLVFIDDFVDILTKIIKKRKKVLRKTLVICGEGVPFQNLTSLIAKSEGVAAPKWHVPVLLMVLLGYGGSVLARFGFSVSLTKDTVITLIRTHDYHSSETERLVGVRAETSLAKGIPKTAAWYNKKEFL